MSDEGEGSKQPDLDEVDVDAVSEEMTDEVLNMMSQVFNQDLTSEVDEGNRQDAVDEVSDFLSGFTEVFESDPSEEEITEYLVQNYNQIAAEILGSDYDNDQDSFMAFFELYEQIDEVMEGVRESHETLGCPEYFDCVKSLSEDLVEEGKSLDFTDGFESISSEGRMVLLQQMLSRYDDKLEIVFENPEIEDGETAKKYLRVYERECEFFKDTAALPIFAVELHKEKETNLDDLRGKRLSTYVNMVSAKSRSRINLLSNPICSDYRNSIAHDDFLIDPVDKEVELLDGDDLVECLSFVELHDLVVETICLTQSLFLFYTLVVHDQNYSVKEELQGNFSE